MENHPDQAAVKLVANLYTGHFPGTNGKAVFSFGTDAPSEAVFTLNGNTYAIEENGWRATVSAAQMRLVK